MNHTNGRVYDPESYSWTSYLKLWGTRGSVPVSGPQYTTYGGNTSCLEVRHNNHLVIIDAGTGIRGLGDGLIHSEIREIHLFFGHTHWDHIIGFPFFLPLYNPEFTIHIYAEQNKEHNIKEALSKVLRPNYFPIRLEEMKADLRYHCLTCRDQVRIGDIRLMAIPCEHPGGALAFRFDIEDKRVGYVTDHEFLKGYRGGPELEMDDARLTAYAELIDFLTGVRPLIHEAQ